MIVLMRVNGLDGQPRSQLRQIDDLDLSHPAHTLRFGLNGDDYEIDLNTENANTLRASLGPYIDVARRAGTPATG